MRRLVSLIMLAAAATSAASPALAWGSSGHRMIATEAMAALPRDLPGFLRAPEAAADVGEWSREPDRWRLAGPAHDTLRDGFHFAYADDDGKLGGGPTFATLPATRAQFAEAVRKAGGDPEAVGYLPYAIIDGWQQLAKDFVYWRADKAGLRLNADPRKQAWLAADQRRREAQILLDAGLLAHYVGDATQPMHLTVHHDGWGDYPNPDGFTNAKVHIPYEGAYVGASIRPEMVRDAMPAPHLLKGPIETEVGAYLTEAAKEARPWYRLEKDGAFAPGDPRGVRYTASRLGVAAGMLRDLISSAWAASAAGKINYPVATIRDIEAGRVDAYTMLRGPD